MIDYAQDTLFGKKVISTIGYNEEEIIKDILYLHGDGNYIDCDPTFSIGDFYKNGLVKPKYKFDLTPQLPEVVQASSDNLPLESESVNIVMFDPPFVIGGENYNDSKKGSSIISKRFTAFKSWDELKNMYLGSLKEFARILKPGGIVIFKCQDIIVSAKNHFTHCWVMNEAVNIGYYPKDLFILLAKSRINDGREQQHGRKYHSYFWVLQKRKSRVEYGLK